LVLAVAWPPTRWILLEANGRKGRFLTRAVRELELEARVEVWIGRAEGLGREVERRASVDLVVARGFGPPAVTAECAAPFLATGGRLAVSEPPGAEPDRWPAGPLAELGLRRLGVRGGVRGGVRDGRAAIMVFTQVSACPGRFPRRSPATRPLF